jgi:hypothetical protein
MVKWRRRVGRVTGGRVMVFILFMQVREKIGAGGRGVMPVGGGNNEG